MYALSAGALLGLSALAAARPSHPSHESASAPPHHNATYSLSAGVAAPTGGSIGVNSTGSGQVAFSFGDNPLKNGFPNVNNPSSELDQIQEAALGTLPQQPPPPSNATQPAEDSILSLGFIAFNELFEVAFFTELIANISSGTTHGYMNDDIKALNTNKNDLLRVLKVVQAQEELHELNANGAFAKLNGGKGPIQPCKYDFPVDNLHDAIALASTFTDVVLATLPDIQTIFANDKDNGLIRGVGSVIGQEGEQNGFYHTLLNQVPSQLPFLTAGSRDFAFNAILQSFVVGDSCPSLGLLLKDKNGQGVGLSTFDVFTPDPNQKFSLEDITAEFILESVNPGLVAPTIEGTHSFLAQPEPHMDGLFVTYINQQNAAFSVPILSSKPIEGTNQVKVTASFPGKTHDLNGLTIGAITNGNGPFADPDAVANATTFGPALIEVNQPISL